MAGWVGFEGGLLGVAAEGGCPQCFPPWHVLGDHPGGGHLPPSCPEAFSICAAVDLKSVCSGVCGKGCGSALLSLSVYGEPPTRIRAVTHAVFHPEGPVG